MDLPARDRIPDLDILLGSIAEEQIVVRKGLKPGGLAHRQASTLQWVMMDEVVPVLGDVAGHCRRRLVGELNTETVVERTTMPIPVIGAELRWEFCRLGA